MSGVVRDFVLMLMAMLFLPAGSRMLLFLTPASGSYAELWLDADGQYILLSKNSGAAPVETDVKHARLHVSHSLAPPQTLVLNGETAVPPESFSVFVGSGGRSRERILKTIDGRHFRPGRLVLSDELDRNRDFLFLLGVLVLVIILTVLAGRMFLVLLPIEDTAAAQPEGMPH